MAHAKRSRVMEGLVLCNIRGILWIEMDLHKVGRLIEITTYPTLDS